MIEGSRDPADSRRLDELLEAMDAVIESVSPDQARIARAAYCGCGRGSGQTADLNDGDRFAYALARALGKPLLFDGDDVVHTEVTLAHDQSSR
jgi:ribonuclease VapC